MTFDTEKLIREVESRKAIWDISSDEYSDRDLKRRQWEEITNIMCEENLSENEKNTFGTFIQEKWEDIIISFSKELKRIAGAKSGSADSRKSPYIFFQQLQFLRETVVNNVTEASINETHVVEGNEGDNVQIHSPATKKKKDDESCIGVLKDISALEDHERNQDSDSDKLFLLSLVEDLRNIPEHRKIPVQIKLIDIIMRAQKKSIIGTQGYPENMQGPLAADPYSNRYGSVVSNNITMENGQNDGQGAYGPGTSNSGQYRHENSTQENYGSSPGTSSSRQNPRVNSTPISDKQNYSTIDYYENLSPDSD